MFYSVDLLSKRKNRKGRMPICWLVGTTSIHKFKKNQLVNFNVFAACDDIIETLTGPENKRISLRTASHLTFGTLQIFQKQLSFLEDECKELLTNIFEAGNRPSQKSTIPSLNEKTEQDVIDLFEKNKPPIDKNKIVEIDLPTVSDFGNLTFFGDEVIYDVRIGPGMLENLDEIDETPRIRQEFTSSTVLPQPIDVMTPPSHLKRKSRKPHDKTPIKIRAIDDRIPVTPTRLRTGLPPPLSSPSELARSPVAQQRSRRSLLPDFMRHAETADISTSGVRHPEANIPDNENDLLGEIQPCAPRFSPPTESIQLPIRVEIEPNLVTDVSARKSAQEDVAVVNASKQPQADAPLKHIPSQEIMQISLQNELKELDNESLSFQLKQKKSKKVVVFDKEKQINLRWETNIYTKKSISLVQVKKDYRIPAKNLLTLPSIGLKLTNNLQNKRHCQWAVPLLNNYVTLIKDNEGEILRGDRQRSSRSSRRFKSLDIQKQFHQFQSTSRSSTNRSSLQVNDPSLHLPQNVSAMDHGHRSLPLPPASEIPEEISQIPPAIDIPEQEMLQILSAIDVPEQEVRQTSISLLRNVDSNIKTHADERHSDILRAQIESEELEASHVSLTVEDLKKLLEKLWNSAAIYDEEEIKIKFEDAFPPEETTVSEVISCILQLCRLEKDYILLLNQNESDPYGPIFIIKATSETNSNF